MKLKAYLGPRAPDQQSGTHWSAFAYDPKQSEQGEIIGIWLWPNSEALRTIRKDNLHNRHRASLRSRLSLTELGRAAVAHREDFSRHNPIDRWWGGTHLTNDRLWRYGPVLTKL
jgi:hypothetical protein